MLDDVDCMLVLFQCTSEYRILHTLSLMMISTEQQR